MTWWVFGSPSAGASRATRVRVPVTRSEPPSRSTSSGRWSLQAQCRPAARHEPVAPPAFLQGSAGTLAPKASALTFYGRLIVGQQLVHDQGCLTVHPGQDVAVGVEGDRHGGMSQHLGDLLGVDVPPEEEGGSRVTKIVEPDHR